MMKLPFDLKFLKNKQRPSNKRFLTIDIGSEVVKCMAFEVAENQHGYYANIIGVGKETLSYGSARSGIVVDIDEVEKSIESAVERATLELGGKIKEVIFGVSGDLSLGLMTTVRLVRAKGDKITDKELDDIYSKIHEASYNQALNELMEITGDTEEDIELITSSLVYTKLDGNEVKDVIGQEGKVLEIAMFTAFTPSFHTKMLQTISKNLGLKILAIGSNMYSLTKSLSFAKGRYFDGVIMDVGGEVTDVGIVFGGGIVSTRSLSIGGAHFTRALGKKLGITYLDAEQKKKSYSFGRLSPDENARVEDNMYEIMEIWLSGIELLFMDFTGVKTFSSQICLVGGGASLPELVNFVNKEPWSKSIPFRSPPEFIKLTLSDLHKVADSTGKVYGLEDIMPASLSIVYLEMGGYLNGIL